MLHLVILWLSLPASFSLMQHKLQAKKWAQQRKAYLDWDCILLLASEGAFLEHSLRLSNSKSQDSGSCLGSKATGQTNNCYDAMQAGATPLPGLEGRLLTHQGNCTGLSDLQLWDYSYKISTGRKSLSGRAVTLDLSEERLDLKWKETSVKTKKSKHLLEGTVLPHSMQTQQSEHGQFSCVVYPPSPFSREANDVVSWMCWI